MRPIDTIYIHHTAGPETATVEDIRRFHVDVRGWSDIGYHYLVSRASGEWRSYRGRPVSRGGAHVLGRNATSLGIAVAGDWSGRQLDPAALRVLLALLVAQCRQHGLRASDVRGHREAEGAHTACPGYDPELVRAHLDLVLDARGQNAVLIGPAVCAGVAVVDSDR